MNAPTAVPETQAEPVVLALPPAPFVPCDAHAEPTTQALFSVALPNGGHITLCGHHAYKHFGVLELTWLHQGNRQKGEEAGS